MGADNAIEANCQRNNNGKVPPHRRRPALLREQAAPFAIGLAGPYFTKGRGGTAEHRHFLNVVVSNEANLFKQGIEPGEMMSVWRDP